MLRRSIWLFLFCSLVLVILFCSRQVSRAATPQVAYWYLDETAPPYSDSINGLSAACMEDCPTAVAGIVGSAQSFDGENTALTVAADPAFNWAADDTFSISLWLKADSGACASDEVFIGRGTAGNGHWALGCNGGGGTVFFSLSDNNTAFKLDSTKILTPGKWQHITAIYDGGSNEATLSVDYTNIVTGSTSLSDEFAPDTADLHIGHLNGGNRFNGALDEVALYTVALTANEIANHYYLARRYTASCSSAVRIMPLGDSITKGSSSGVTLESEMISYRKTLWHNLIAASYPVDFVGSLTNGQTYDGFDPHHEGWPAYTKAQVRDGVIGWLNTNPADIVLLHIGTNAVSTSVTEDDQLLNNIDAYDENITVVLARIINRINDDITTTSYNNALASLAATRIANGDKIILVDMENGADLNYAFQPTGDMWDNLHPYHTGYDKIAAVWYSALGTILQPCTEFGPTITSQPVLKATIGLPYQYAVQATGNPPPAFSLTTAPAGMTIDANGLIEWTPMAVGEYPVTVTAVNSQGSDVQSFTIIVPSSPVPAVCRADAIAYWKLDETSGSTFADSVGTNDGSCTNCPTPATGRVNGAQTFNGASTRITVPHNASLNVEESFTVSAWVNTSSCTGGSATVNNKVAMGKRSGGADWWLGCNGLGNAVFSLKDNNNISSLISSNSTTINGGQWVHLVGIRDGSDSGQNRLHVNGGLAALSNPSYTGNFNNSEALTIGWYNVSPFYQWAGEVDEVALYNRALTPAEITRQYQAGLLNFCYDVDNWTVANGDWDDDNSWYGTAPGTSDYAVISHTINLSAAATTACVDVMSEATLDFGGNELSVEGAFNNYGTVQQTKAVNTVSGLVEFLHVRNSAADATKYRGTEITPTSTALGEVTVTIRTPNVAGGDHCTSDPGSPPYADRCFTLTAGTDGSATVRLYAANPDELNGIAVSDLRPYRFTTEWEALTPASTGTSGDFVYAQADTPGFSSFLLGGLQNPTAVSLHTFSAASPSLSIGLVFLLGLLLAAPTANLLHRRRG
ncbi:MAG: LamG-like jellyroll fold domain-containing protein [Chloroflexota bacterium]